MDWRVAVLKFLEGFVPAFIKLLIAERKRLRGIADGGAADQRKADETANQEAVEDARKDQADIRKASDSDLARRVDDIL
jgi:hypothetical protein